MLTNHNMKMAFYTLMRIRWGSPKPFFKRFFWTSLVVISGGLALGTNIGYQYRCQFSASMSVLGIVWFSNICYYQITIPAFMIAIFMYKTIHYRARSSWVSTTWTLSTLVAFGGRLQMVLQLAPYYNKSIAICSKHKPAHP